MSSTCESCRRLDMEMMSLTIDGHTAKLCVTCQHVLQKDKERFFQLVRSKTKAESNGEMKKKHRLLSSLLVVGVAGIGLIIGIGVAESAGIFAESNSIDQTEYLSFALLKQLQ